jgi:hypothetical protein
MYGESAGSRIEGERPWVVISKRQSGGLRASRNASSAARSCLGSCSGTSLKLSFAPAYAGITVLAPGPA